VINCQFVPLRIIIIKEYILININAIVFLAGLSGKSYGQQQSLAGPSDTLVVLWSSGDRDVAEKACLMYTSAAKKFKWFNELILVVWGPSEKLLAENAALKEKVAVSETIFSASNPICPLT
jgi:hypothetical protein